MRNMEEGTMWTLIILALLFLGVSGFFLIRCLTQGKECQSVHRLEGKCILITGADTPLGIELVREMCKRGAEKVKLLPTIFGLAEKKLSRN